MYGGITRYSLNPLVRFRSAIIQTLHRQHVLLLHILLHDRTNAVDDSFCITSCRTLFVAIGSIIRHVNVSDLILLKYRVSG